MAEMTLNGFIKKESAGGILLVVAALLAMLLVNSPLAWLYDGFLDIPIAVQVGKLVVAKPLLLWINDGLMAVFFLLVGMEIKREVLEGELASLSQLALPGLGAVGGMALPALLYVGVNHADPLALEGWAIPTATDIAFALGLLALLGDRVPPSLKIFLMTLAVLDDLAGIVIIALFYTADLSLVSLGLSLFFVLLLFLMNRAGVNEVAPYVMVGLLLWLSVLKSGVHATLAGVVLAFAIPLRPVRAGERSLLRELEDDLHPLVAFAILPLFAFANAGVPLGGMSPQQLLGTVPLGIAVGLFIGKQLGVFGFCWLGIKLGLAQLPQGMTWRTLHGVALLCGVGFTMSLFIGSLAFEHVGTDYVLHHPPGVERLGIMAGSLLSAILGLLLLHRALPRTGG